MMAYDTLVPIEINRPPPPQPALVKDITTHGTLQHVDQDGTITPLELDIQGKFEKGFFRDGNKWATCAFYRRFFFDMTCSYTLSPVMPADGGIQFVPQGASEVYNVREFAMTLSATTQGRVPVKLAQYPIVEPPPRPLASPTIVRLDPKNKPKPLEFIPFSPVPDKPQPKSASKVDLPKEHTFERIQFRFPVTNNRKYDPKKQYRIVVDLLADIGGEFIKIGERRSPKVVVLSRTHVEQRQLDIPDPRGQPGIPATFNLNLQSVTRPHTVISTPDLTRCPTVANTPDPVETIPPPRPYLEKLAQTLAQPMTDTAGAIQADFGMPVEWLPMTSDGFTPPLKVNPDFMGSGINSVGISPLETQLYGFGEAAYTFLEPSATLPTPVSTQFTVLDPFLSPYFPEEIPPLDASKQYIDGVLEQKIRRNEKQAKINASMQRLCDWLDSKGQLSQTGTLSSSQTPPATPKRKLDQVECFGSRNRKRSRTSYNMAIPLTPALSPATTVPSSSDDDSFAALAARELPRMFNQEFASLFQQGITFDDFPENVLAGEQLQSVMAEVESRLTTSGVHKADHPFT